MDVVMPQLGETVTEGTISAWFKSVGETVAAGENLFEIETDKTAMEVQALESGVLTEIRAQIGESLAVGAVVAVIGEAGQGASPKQPAAAAPKPKPAETPPARAVAPAPAVAANGAHLHEGFGPFSEVRTPARNYGSARRADNLKVTPLARRLAEQSGIDLDAIAEAVSAGGGWRIAKADIEAHRPAARPAASGEAVRPVLREDVDVVPLNLVRRKTARYLAQSWAQAPHVLQAVEVDFHRIESARRALNEVHAERWGVKLTPLAFIARAVCLAIADFPRINASLDGDDLLVHRHVNLGIAVDLDHDGLIVPVIHRAGELNLLDLARAMAEKVVRARSGKLTPDDYSGGTYTISNSGTFGTLITAPIVNAPEVAILSTDGIRKKPVAVETDSGDAVVV
ncbi:MAG TPA: dihydrolipoamide acetyltransferase family protein, partial [Afifellaceae bacterium]|nr:dihydrolipoamide acetyltransferase family protein [Afifellaceae bacterium]